jgi:hypothetical protein
LSQKPNVKNFHNALSIYSQAFSEPQNPRENRFSRRGQSPFSTFLKRILLIFVRVYRIKGKGIHSLER